MKPKETGRKKALRKRAEQILPDTPAAPPPATYGEALHELHVHQIELELQIDELRRSEIELQKMRDRYLSLYDQAPVGYVTLDRHNLITQANSAASSILGLSKSSLRTRSFSSFLEEGAWSTFYSVSADVRSAKEKRTFDAQLASVQGAPRWVKLDLAAQAESGDLLVTLIDVTEQRNAERQLRQLADGLIKLQEKERKAIAEALHDDAGQQLTYLTIILDHSREDGARLDPDRIEQLGDVARKVLQGIRALSASLSPAELGRVGLAGALQGMISEFTARTRIPVSLSTRGILREQPFEVSLAVYRIIQEALTNAARHAQPGSVGVTLLQDPVQFSVTVRDDGKGFNVEEAPPTSLGLLSMKERARSVGGKIVIQSSPGRGTQVTFERVEARQRRTPPATPDEE